MNHDERHHEPPPPSDEARRLWLTRRLLRSAVRSYQLTLAFCHEVDASLPDDFRPPWKPDAEPEGERKDWWNLVYETNSAHYAAETALAERIFNLFDKLAPDERKVGKRVEGSEFIQPAVTLDGQTFVLVSDPANHNDDNDIIIMVSRKHIIDLGE